MPIANLGLEQFTQQICVGPATITRVLREPQDTLAPLRRALSLRQCPWMIAPHAALFVGVFLGEQQMVVVGGAPSLDHIADERVLNRDPLLRRKLG
jgi:hypothetical protein